MLIIRRQLLRDTLADSSEQPEIGILQAAPLGFIEVLAPDQGPPAVVRDRGAHRAGQVLEAGGGHAARLVDVELLGGLAVAAQARDLGAAVPLRLDHQLAQRDPRRAVRDQLGVLRGLRVAERVGERHPRPLHRRRPRPPADLQQQVRHRVPLRVGLEEPAPLPALGLPVQQPVVLHHFDARRE